MKKKSYNEILEEMYLNMDKIDNNFILMKEQISEFKPEDQIKINFKECHVAICPNGGLIAICKKKDYYIEDQYSKIREYILILHQDGKTNYSIPIDWIYEKRWIVELDFNEKEQLFGICNDGSILKFDIINSRAVKKITFEHFQNDNIYKAKFLGKGFIALTETVTRRKIYLKVRGIINAIGLIVLFAFAGILIVKDIIRFII